MAGRRHQRRPKGTMHPTDTDWKKKVRKLLDESRGRQADAARAIGCDPSAITAMLKPESRQSRLAGPLSKFLGIDPPRSLAIEDTERADGVRTLRGLTPDEYELAVEFMRMLEKRRH